MTINTTIADELTAKNATVELKVHWGDPWVEYPELEVIRFAKRCAPAMSDATLLWRFGKIESRTGTVSLVAPLSIDRYWARIKITSPHSGSAIVWHGLIIADTEQRAGTQSFGRQGNQTFSLVGMEWSLSRRPILGSVVKDPATGDPVAIQRGLAFNAGRGVETSQAFSSPGNRTNVVTPDGVYAFDWPGDSWTAAEMVSYLLFYYQPMDAVTGFDYSIDADALDVLAGYKPENVVTHGRSLLEILNQIIDRRAGYTWSVEMNALETLAVIKVHTYTAADITLPSGETLPANANSHTWPCDEERETNEVVIVRDSGERFEEVRVEGSRRGVCFTAKYGNATLAEGWSSSERTDYLDAETGVGGDVAEQRFLSDTARQRAQLEKVYTWHVLPDTIVAGSLDSNILCPILNRNGTDSGTEAKFFYEGIVVQRGIPVGTQEFEEWPPILVAAPVIGGRYENLAKLSSIADAEGDKRHAVNVGVDVVPLVDYPGIRLIPAGMPHFLGKNDFDFAHADTSDTLAKIDYNEIQITMFIECDDYCHTLYPTSLPAPVNDQTSLLLVSVGERGRLDRIIKDTVTDVVDGVLTLAPSSSYLRDDRTWMKDMARMLWEYHGKTRKSLHVGLKQLSGAITIGTLITTFGNGGGAETIEAVVTEIEWDVRAQTTSVKTQFGELDVVAIASPRTSVRDGMRNGGSFIGDVNVSQAVV